MKRILEGIATRASDYLYHRWYKSQAERVLRSIESVKERTDPKLIKLSDEYAKDVLGWRGYAPWLYVYSAVAETFKEGWIPDNYYGKVVLPVIDGGYGTVSNLKPLSRKLFRGDVFSDIAYYVNGLFYSDSYEVISRNQIAEVLFGKADVVVFKVDTSSQGLGVRFFEKHTFDAKKIYALGNGVFQKYIKQHKCFEELMPASVATVRITTAVDDSGHVSVRACYLRLGRIEDKHVRSASHVRIPINRMSGALETQGYLTSWLTTERHPDTGVLFAGKRIPCFEDCVSVAEDLHKLMPYARCIGWDLCVDRDEEVKVMEWNGGHNDIKFSEATQGPCFSDLGWERLWQKRSC